MVTQIQKNMLQMVQYLYSFQTTKTLPVPFHLKAELVIVSMKKLHQQQQMKMVQLQQQKKLFIIYQKKTFW